MKTRVASAAIAAMATAALLAGCGGASSAPPPFGATSLSAPGEKYVIATVGDSHAVRFAQGMTDVAEGRYDIVGAGYGGCGIMRQSRYKLTTSGIDDVEQANRACDDWDVKWQALVNQSKPDATLLTTSYWDANAQDIDGSGTFRTITDPTFRKQYKASLQRGIDILSSQGGRVYLDNSLPYLGHDMPSAEAMSKAVTEVYEEARKAGKNVGLLDLRHQLCTGTTCPATIDGIAVLDETGHPDGESLARQSRWILNTIAADLEASTK